MPVIAIIIIVAIVGVGAAVFASKRGNDTSATPITESAQVTGFTPPPSTTEQVAEVPTVVVESNTFKDGTYTKTGSYTSPAGKETVTIAITIKDDVVTNATFTGNATNPGSVKNQTKFSEGYSAQVVGKPIEDIALTVVNGSSLTPKGFMDALAQIQTEARI